MLMPTRRAAACMLCAGLWPPAWCQPAAVPQGRPGSQEAPPSASSTGALPAALHETIARQFTDITSVVVVQRGAVVFEHYQAGTDADAVHGVQSVTKSVLALLVGAALDRGALQSLDQPVAALLPTPDSPSAQTGDPPITIRHLLTMTSGYAPARAFGRADVDDPQVLLQRPRRAAPGTQFLYDNLAVNLLSIALESAIKQPLSAFAQQALFEPLGIEAFEWETGSHGYALGFAGLRLRTLDMARLGQLVLQRGRWQARQLIDERFVIAATQAHSAGGAPAGLPYGYLWWVVPARPAAGAAGGAGYFASGFGGQLIWVYPPLGLVVATTAVVSEASNARGHGSALIQRHILPALSAAGSAGR